MKKAKFVILLIGTLMLMGCGTKSVGTAVEKKCEHSYGEWITEKEATCLTDGKEVRTCSLCDETEERTVKATGHSYGEWNVTKEATCTEDGAKEQVCVKCGDVVSEVIPGGHKYGEWIKVTEADCLLFGVSEQDCEVCGYQNIETSPALGHNMTEATCTTASVCTRCGEIGTPALGHNYVNGICKRCGESFAIELLGTTNLVGNYYTDGFEAEVLEYYNDDRYFYITYKYKSLGNSDSIPAWYAYFLDENNNILDEAALICDLSKNFECGKEYSNYVVYPEGTVKAVILSYDANTPVVVADPKDMHGVEVSCPEYVYCNRSKDCAYIYSYNICENNGTLYFAMCYMPLTSYHKGESIVINGNCYDSNGNFLGEQQLSYTFELSPSQINVAFYDYTILPDGTSRIEVISDAATGSQPSVPSGATGSSSNEAESSDKWSYSDATSLSNYISRADSCRAKMSEKIGDSYNISGAIAYNYYMAAQQYCIQVKGYLSSALTLANSKASLDLQSGGTLAGKIQEAINVCDEIINMDITRDNAESVYDTISTKDIELYQKMMALTTLSEKLLEAY